MYLSKILIFITILPLINFISICSLWRFIGYKWAARVTILNIILSKIGAIFFFISFYIGSQEVLYLNLGSWACVGDLTINFSFLYDKLSITMFAVILLVSYFVHLYSCAYMKNDPHFSRFLSYLSLFTFFMLVLVSAYNLLVVFIGW
jgi:NADH-quinone oxidoreductase subunit L